MALVICPCGFRLHRLAQSVLPGLGTVYVCSYVLSYVCSPMCALLRVLSYLYSPICVLLCVLSDVCSPMCAFLCVPIYVLSNVCADMPALLCALLWVLSHVCFYMCAFCMDLVENGQCPKWTLKRSLNILQLLTGGNLGSRPVISSWLHYNLLRREVLEPLLFQQEAPNPNPPKCPS